MHPPPRKKSTNRTSGTCGTIAKIPVIRVPEKERSWIRFLKKEWLKISQIKWNINIQIQEGKRAPYWKTKEIHTKIHLCQISENHKNRKSGKQPKKNNTLPRGGKQLERQWISHQELWRLEGSEKTCFKYWDKRAVNPESYIQWKHPSRVRGKSRLSQVKENRICLVSRTTLRDG